MLQVFNYEGNEVQFELVDGHVMANATVMCQPFGKRPNDWLALSGTKRYIDAITRKNGNSVNQLVVSRTGAADTGGGTWIDEKLIVKLAQWISVDFELWCDEKIAELLKEGKVELVRMTPAEMLLQSAQQLVNHERQIKELQESYRVIESNIQGIVSQITTRPDYYTIAGFASKYRVKIGNDIAKPLGMKASKICKDRSVPVDRVNDTKWGSVGSYPSDVLEEIFVSHGLIK